MKNESFRDWRLEKGLSIDQIHDKTGLETSTISKWDVYPDREPRKVYRKILIKKFPDCPLAYL